jgi:hypothetical protein
MAMEIEGRNIAAAAQTVAGPVNPHVLWRQLIGLVLWVGVIPFFCGGPVASILGLVLGGVTFADAWTSGIYKIPGKQTFSNISPMGWGIVMALLLVVGYPMYLVKRNELRTLAGLDRLYGAVVVLGGLVLFLCILATVIRFLISTT